MPSSVIKNRKGLEELDYFPEHWGYAVVPPRNNVALDRLCKKRSNLKRTTLPRLGMSKLNVLHRAVLR